MNAPATPATGSPADGAGVDTAAVRAWLVGLQQRIVAALEAADGTPFRHDAWKREPPAATDGAPAPALTGGGGITRIVEEGGLLERGGVGFSHVTGNRLPPSATAARPQLAGRAWEAMGVSLVLHPRNPFVPTVHMNVRCFVAAALPDAVAGTPEAEPIWWFGGGMDLTPYYGFDEDAVHFHRTCRDALAPFGDDRHARYKKWCDDYFFLKHRGEPRGVGGVFFDDLSEPDFDTAFALTRSVGDRFLDAWLPIAERRRGHAYGEREREWQAIRRGRYVEFNLVWDRGTLFGLQSGGRTESILMSMPPSVRWAYEHRPDPGTPEAELLERFLVPRDWA